MLKRILMIWLIISTLGYGSVWAFDSHIDEVTEHQEIVDDIGRTSHDDEDQSSCDHCCHASAHMLALWPVQSATVCPDACSIHTPYLHTLSFNTPSQPERPPQG